MKLEFYKRRFYHIYNRGINSCLIFENDENKVFLNQFSKYLGGKVKLLAYCLMDNHFHFVIQISVEKRVTQGFSNFFNSY
jgi:REP element-mobilizing transposase RayT